MVAVVVVVGVAVVVGVVVAVAVVVAVVVGIAVGVVVAVVVGIAVVGAVVVGVVVGVEITFNQEKNMNIEQMTVGQIKEIQALFGSKKSSKPLAEPGKKVFIRTVTHHYTGEVVECNREWMELKDAAWIADDGRFNNFLKTGSANEVEPFEDNVRIPIGGILDITEWRHELPRAVK